MFGKRVTNDQWTEKMLDFLKRLGQGLGYEVETEPLRIDQMWKQQDKAIVVIEHEIKHETVFKKEMPNLIKVKAPLKVVVTYVRDYRFPYGAVEFADKVGIWLSKKVDEINSDEEFLVVIGTKTPFTKTRGRKGLRDFVPRPWDWLAYRFYLVRRIRREVLQTPASSRSQAAIIAWRTRKRGLEAGGGGVR